MGNKRYYLGGAVVVRRTVDAVLAIGVRRRGESLRKTDARAMSNVTVSFGKRFARQLASIQCALGVDTPQIDWLESESSARFPRSRLAVCVRCISDVARSTNRSN